MLQKFLVSVFVYRVIVCLQHKQLMTVPLHIKQANNFGLEHAQRKVEGSGPALIVVELEQTVNTNQ